LNGESRSSSSSNNSSNGGLVLRRSSRISGSSSGSNQPYQRGEFNGVLGESKTTAFELWREIVMYL